MTDVQYPEIRDKCLKVESDLAGKGVKLKPFLAKAKLSYPQWWNYKKGLVEPRMGTWLKIEKAVKEIMDEA